MVVTGSPALVAPWTIGLATHRHDDRPARVDPPSETDRRILHRREGGRTNRGRVRGPPRIGDTAVMPGEKRVDFDLESYIERVRTGPCFVCAIARGDASSPAHVVTRDEHHIAFLPNLHVLRGYVLVAPIEHREAVVGDFSLDEYLALHRVVHRVARALQATVPTERVYILSLGSQQGNTHVHWHVAALPPGVPYDEQQFPSLDDRDQRRPRLDRRGADRPRRSTPGRVRPRPLTPGQRRGDRCARSGASPTRTASA